MPCDRRQTTSAAKKVAPLAALAVGSVLSTWAEVVPANVREWPGEAETVTPSGWTTRGIALYQADKTVTFNATGDYAVSPEYQGYVTQLVVSVCSTQPVLLRNLKAIPEAADVSARTWTMDFTPEPRCAEQSFSWRTSEKVRRFRLQIEGSQGGNWRVGALTAYVDRVEAPQGLAEDSRYSDALPVSWEPEARAVSHEVEAARVCTVLPQFNLLERWDFSVLTNATGNPLGFEDVPGAASLRGVSGEYLNVQAHSGGYVQAGNTKGAGKMRLELASEGRRTALLRMYRSEADGTDGRVIVAVVGAGGATNTVSEPFLTTSPRGFQAELPDDASELLIRSDVKSRRFRIEDVMIVNDYVSGSVTTNVAAATRTSRRETVLRGLAPGDWLWRVRSIDRAGCRSLWSPYRAVRLDESCPPFNKPGMVIVIR